MGDMCVAPTTKGMVFMKHLHRFFIVCMACIVGSLCVPGMPVFAQALTCADFTSPDAAQVALDSQADFADGLDPDGNGIACDHDEAAPSAEAYLAGIRDELDALQNNVNRYLEIDRLGANASAEERNELNQIAADWIDYPDVAAEFVAPEGLEEIGQSYLDLADSFRAAGVLWEAFWSLPSGDPGEEPVLNAFNQEFLSAQNDLVALGTMIEAAGGPATDDSGTEPTGSPEGQMPAEVLAYLETVSNTASEWDRSIDRFSELYVNSIAAGTSIPAADAEEMAQIVAAWIEAPNVAAGIDVPAGYENIQATHEAFAKALADAATAFTAELGGEGSGTALAFSIANAQTLYDDLDALLTEAGS